MRMPMRGERQECRAACRILSIPGTARPILVRRDGRGRPDSAQDEPSGCVAGCVDGILVTGAYFIAGGLSGWGCSCGVG
jgi:hypothetical protein